MNSFSPANRVVTRRWLQDEDDCAIVQLAVPDAGVELDASLRAVSTRGQTSFSLMVRYDNGRQWLEYATPLSARTTDGSPVDCAQSLQAIVSSPLFALNIARPFVARLRAEGLLAREG